MFGKKTVVSQEQPIEAMSYDGLLGLKNRVDDELARRNETELEAMKQRLELVAQSQGVSVADLFKKPRKKRDLVIRYRDPENPENTWTGMGKTKKWLQEKLDAGHSLEEFAVQ
jgi:DNA-binding protein H-NS